MSNIFLVLRNAGRNWLVCPNGALIPMPKATKGYRDILRLMMRVCLALQCLYTSYHAGSYVGGPLALIQNSDMIEVDIPNPA